MPTIHTPERSHSSGRGRSSTAHGRAKPVPAFAFGSSTPRDLSHQISAVGRKGLKAKLEEGNDGRRDILYYMHKAKSIEGRGGAKGSGYAFGSSTPRSLSHLSKIPREQRVYDAKPARERTTEGDGGVRMSATNPQLANYQQRKGGGHQSMSTESRNGADEASSEPDIVQDRQTDYGRTTVGGGPKKDSGLEERDRGRGKAKLSGAGQSSRKNTKQEKEKEHEGGKESNKMMREEEEEGGRKEGTREDRKEGGGMEEMESKPEEEEEARTGKEEEEEEPETGKEEEEE